MTELGELLPRVATDVPGPRAAAQIELLARAECPALTARRARRSELSGAPEDPIVWTRARGANVVDSDGNVYVDLSAGFGAAAIGHAHPRLVEAITRQSGTLLHGLGDLHPSDTKIALLGRLAELAPFPDARVILGLSGSDAVEAALKTAYLHTGKPGVLAFASGYHGLSYGAVAVCGHGDAFRAAFAAQVNPHVGFVPYPRAGASLDGTMLALEAKARGLGAEVGAVIAEPVLGRGGVIVPPQGLLAALARFCRQRGALLVVDEIMTGLSRTGALYASGAEAEHADLVCLGKALGGGLPVSACLGRAEVMRAWGQPGRQALHTATFFGNPLASVAALTTLDILCDERLGERATALGEHLLCALRRLQADGAEITDVRGRGLLVGVELRSGARALSIGRALLARGYITVPAGADARVLSLTPPLTITRAQLDGFVRALAGALGSDP